MSNNTKIVLRSVGVFSVFVLLVIAVFVVKNLPNETDNDDFCQLDSNEKGSCVSENKCSGITLPGENEKSQCQNDKICCPRNFLFPDEITIKQLSTNSSVISLESEQILIERVGLRRNDGEIREFKNHRKCGSASGDRIYNGDFAAPKEFPFFVALKYKIDPTDTYAIGRTYGVYCGGSLISGSFI